MPRNEPPQPALFTLEGVAYTAHDLKKMPVGEVEVLLERAGSLRERIGLKIGRTEAALASLRTQFRDITAARNQIKSFLVPTAGTLAE